MSFKICHVILTIVVVPICMLVAATQLLDECTVKRALKYGRIPGSIPDWLCIIFYDTRYNYTAVKYYAPLGPRYGLFQFQSPTWCTTPNQRDPKGRTNKCNTDCNKFLDDDLSDDIECAKKIYSQFGYNYWSIWFEYCYDKKTTSQFGSQCL